MVAASAILAGLAAGGCESAPETPKTETYVSQAEGFSLTFPSDWKKSAAGFYGMNLEIIPPDQTNPNVFRDDIFVRVEPLVNALSLDDYVAIKVAKGVKNMPDYKELQKGPARLGGVDAQRLVYSYANGDVLVTSITYFLVSGTRGYLVAANAVSNRFPDRKPQFEEIVGTFRLLNQPTAAPPTAPAAPAAQPVR
jgi:hypothetical protein